MLNPTGRPASTAKFLRRICKKFKKIKARIGEKSRPPIGGRNILNGLKKGSATCTSNATAGCLLLGATQLIIIPNNIIQNIILKLKRITEKKDQ